MADDPLFEQIPEVMSRLGTDLSIRAQNSLSIERYGNAEGVPCYKAHFGRDERCPGCMVKQVLAMGRTDRWNMADNRSERPTYYEVTIAPILDDEGRVKELIEIIRDDTLKFGVEQHLIQTSEGLEAEVADRSRELEELTTRTDGLREQLSKLREDQTAMVQTEKMASLGRLAAGLTHEIHTPLGALISNLDILNRIISKSDPPDETLKELLELQQLAADRIHKIVRSLRNFAHLDRAEEEPYDLHEGIEASLALLAHQVKGRIEVVREFGDLPAVRCKADAINQVFMNLLQNAVHAIEESGEIRVTTRVEGDQAVLEFRDSGKGIAKEHVEKLFEPGFTTKPRGVGTGLGLAIAYTTMTDHKGEIEVESAPGRGTLFTLRLPIAGGFV